MPSWELRFFFEGSRADYAGIQQKLCQALNISPFNVQDGEQRTDVYVQLNEPSVGFKFRGDVSGNKGALECKIRTKGGAPLPEKWEKKKVGKVTADKKSIKKAVVGHPPAAAAIPSLDNFETNRDLIRCAKSRQSYSLQNVKINKEILPSGLPKESHQVSMEFAAFSLSRLDGESLGSYYSITFEAGLKTKKIIKNVGKILITEYLNFPNTCSMGYPEFIMTKAQ